MTPITIQPVDMAKSSCNGQTNPRSLDERWARVSGPDMGPLGLVATGAGQVQRPARAPLQYVSEPRSVTSLEHRRCLLVVGRGSSQPARILPDYGLAMCHAPFRKPSPLVSPAAMSFLKV